MRLRYIEVNQAPKGVFLYIGRGQHSADLSERAERYLLTFSRDTLLTLALAPVDTTNISLSSVSDSGAKRKLLIGDQKQMDLGDTSDTKPPS